MPRRGDCGEKPGAIAVTDLAGLGGWAEVATLTSSQIARPELIPGAFLLKSKTVLPKDYTLAAASFLLSILFDLIDLFSQWRTKSQAFLATLPRREL